MPPRAATLPLLIVQGDWLEARDLAEVTRVQGTPLERQMAVTILGNLAHYRGDTELAWAMVHEFMPRGPDSGPGDTLFPYAIETLRLAVRLALDASAFDEAREWLGSHDRWLKWSGAVRGRAESKLLWAQLCRLEGDLPSSERRAGEALSLAADPRQPLTLLAIYRFLGRLSMDGQRYDDADRELRNALDLAETCAAPYERARTLLELANLYLLTGREKGVLPLLNDVRNTAISLEATPLLTALENLQANLETGKTETTLTARETDVLRLVAQGMKDSEVAEQLYISPRTVGQHLRSIYNKLDVPSRAAATRRAIEDHLV